MYTYTVTQKKHIGKDNVRYLTFLLCLDFLLKPAAMNQVDSWKAM